MNQGQQHYLKTTVYSLSHSYFGFGSAEIGVLVAIGGALLISLLLFSSNLRLGVMPQPIPIVNQSSSVANMLPHPVVP